MKQTILFLILFFAAHSFAAKDSTYYDWKKIEIQELRYLLEDGHYDSVSHEAAHHLSDQKISYPAMVEINSIRIEAVFELNQFAMVNQLFKNFRANFPLSEYMLPMSILNMRAYKNRRHYYDAVLSGNLAINQARKPKPELYRSLINECREMIYDEITVKELSKIYPRVDDELKDVVRERMLDEGVTPPEDTRLIKTEIWSDKVHSNNFRGSALVGLDFPLSMNEDLQQGLALQFTGLYRVVNGFAPGVHIELNLWKHKIADDVEINGTVEQTPGGGTTLAIPILAVPRIYAPQYRNFKAYFEPGIGVTLFNEDTNSKDTNSKDTQFLLTTMADFGFTFFDLLEVRPGVKIVFDNGETVSWMSLAIGMVIR